jgi:serine/threonine protein kinase/tetratricopeptide (TPR) repeat protein
VTDVLQGLVGSLPEVYAVEREIGRGGMAIVYLATDRRHHRQVAIKVLRPEIARCLGADRFLREIGIVSRLTHPHILPLLDSGGSEELLWYIMPYVEGDTLRLLLQRERRLPIEQVLQIAADLASAVSWAHTHDIVHRDIKPENILLEGGQAVISDFGLARAVRIAAGEELTDSGLVLGTPSYMSPEQAQPGEVIDGRSDIYSLGCTIYEMLAGQPPFSGPDAQSIIVQHLGCPAPSLRVLRPTVPAWLDQVVMTALAKTPADRFPSGEAFAAALRGGATPIDSKPVSASGDRPWPVRHAMQWLTALIVAAGVFVLIARTMRDSHRSRVSSDGPGSPVVLVSSFQTGSDDTIAKSVARSLSQAMIDSFATISGLRTVPTSGETSRETDSLLRGAELSLLVAGSIERRGNDLKAIGRVSEGQSRIQLFSQGQQAAVAAAPVLEADLIERIVRFVRRHVGTELRRRAVAAETKDSAARNYWSRAMSIIDAISSPEATALPKSTADRLVVADSLLAEALRRDPQWVGPYLARGWAYLGSASIYASEGQRDSARISAHLKAVAAADTAIRIAPADADAHELRGVALIGLWFETPSEKADSIGEEAERNLRRAISLDLNVARAWEALGTYYLLTGRFGEGRQAIAQALQADAFLLSEPQVLRWQILADLNLEDYADAQKTCARGARWYPLDLAFMNCQYMILGWSADDLKSAKRAWQLASKAENLATPARRSDVHRTKLLMTAAILARAGYGDSAESLLRTFVGTRKGGIDIDGFASDEAYVRLLVGQQDEALALLKIFLHYNWAQRGYIARTPWYRSLHGNPAFIAMTERRP